MATVPTAVQVASLVEYCQAPVLLLSPVTAMPCTAPGSGSLTMPAISVETWLPPLPGWSSLIVVKGFAPESTGASLLTVIVDVAVAVLKAELPPLTVVSASLPAVPLVWSQARNVTPPVEPMPLGTSRR